MAGKHNVPKKRGAKVRHKCDSTGEGQLKRGLWSHAEEDVVRARAPHDPPEVIAAAINRSVEKVRQFIRDNKLGKVVPTTEGGRSQKEILNTLRKENFYQTLKGQLNTIELKIFEDNYVLFMEQFGGDALPSERLEIKQLLFLEIIQDRVLTEEKDEIDISATLRKQELALSAIPHDQRERVDAQILSEVRARLAVCSEKIKELRRTFKDLLDKSGKVRAALTSSRAKRTEALDHSKFDVTSMLKMLQDHEYRKEAARQMEIMAAAQSSAHAKFREFHTFSDGAVERIITNSEGVEDGS